MEIQKNVSLKGYTSFKIGGPAKYFVEVNNIEEVIETISWARKNNYKTLFIGGGSNMLISDKGFDGLAVRLNLQQLSFESNKVIAGAGIILAFLLNKTLENGLTGLEFAAGIPGTVGGAIRGNAGTYGLAMSDVVKKIKYLDLIHNELKEMSVADANFVYRHSIFKENKNLVLEVELVLERGDVEEARKLIKERLQHRHDTQPNEPSAGCIFKNISFDEVDLDDLRKRNIDVDKFANTKKIPAAYLIDKADLKGKTIGGAQISEKHGNYIINTGQATAEQVIMLISFIKQQIRDKYGVQLQEEVHIVL